MPLEDYRSDMKISYNWLKKYINIDLDPKKVAELLTNSGLEVEGITPFQSVPGGFKGLVIGEVKTCAKHPNADKLSLTTVDIGTDTLLNIVCGAPNVAAGQKVVVATVGTMLYPATGEPFEIKKSKIRGEASEGMICAEDEIGLGKSHEGIMVLPADTKTGLSAAEYFNIEEDVVFEIGLTPNRADAASHIGVARDLAAVINSEHYINFKDQKQQVTLSLPSVNDFSIDLPLAETARPIEVEVVNIAACPRYSGITINSVEVKESPAWLKNKLKSIGVGSINNVVDATNYVLHECGQPLHAFDADEITGNKVIVRTANEGEKFITLDAVERTLTADNLMICNTTEPMCIAGVFGGIKSGISEKTKNVFLESAYFSPASIRKTSKHHGLKTDASFRFERGTDPEITVYALKRAAMLIKEIAGGQISSNVIDNYPAPAEHKKIQLVYASVNRLIGKEIENDIIKNIIISLGMQIMEESGEGLLLSVPSFKVDVTREVDVTEEILRVYGYNNIELPAQLRTSLSFSEKKDKEKITDIVANYLSSNGFFELLTNSLTKSKYDELPGSAANRSVKILNALSQDLDVMRQQLLFSGLEAIEYNKNRKHADIRFYEFGKTYAVTEKGYREENHLAIYLSGKKFADAWNTDKSTVNFFFLKNFVENILTRTGIDTGTLKKEFLEGNNCWSSGLSYYAGETLLVSFGSVSKQVLKTFDLNQEIFYADFNWDHVIKKSPGKAVRYKEVSKFPQVKRDLSMLIDRAVHYSVIETIAFATEKNLLKEIHLFDVYEGDSAKGGTSKIAEGKKSVALSFILQDDQQTLTEKQIEKSMSRLMDAFEKQANAVIRKQ